MEYGDGVPGGALRFGDLVVSRNSHCFIGDISEDIAAGLRIRVHTYRGEVHQAWEDNGPDVLGINDVATIELWE